MDRSRALELLTQSKPLLMERCGVTRLALFGSTVRNAAQSGSDFDFLVAFDGPPTSERYFGVQFYLEDLFGCSVDLVTDKALRQDCARSSKRKPCMSEPAQHAWRLYVDEMIRCAERVIAYIDGLDQSSFVGSSQSCLRMYCAIVERPSAWPVTAAKSGCCWQ